MPESTEGVSDTDYIRYWQASGESLKTSVRTRTRLEQLTGEGHYTGGTVAFGYKRVRLGRVNKKNQEVCDLVIDEAEAGGIKAMRLPAALCKMQRKKRETDGFSKSTWMTPPGSHPTSGFGARHSLPKFFRHKKRHIVQNDAANWWT